MVSNDISPKCKTFVRLIIEWETGIVRPFPWREKTTPYRVFVSEVLLKRTTSKAAVRIYNEFLSIYPDIKTLSQAETEEVLKLLKPIGLYRQRAHGLKQAAMIITIKHNGSFPNNLKDLLDIPHIGLYTAGAIMSLSYGIPAPMLDSNAYRVISRAFNSFFGNSPKFSGVYIFLNSIIPKGSIKHFNWGLIDLGATICTPKRCFWELCPIYSICELKKKYTNG